MNKYKPSEHKFNDWVDLPLADIVGIVKTDSTSLERSDLKAIILELAERIKNLQEDGLAYQRVDIT